MTAAPIEALYRDLMASWNNRDAAAWGELFTEDGNLVGFDGSQVDSRGAITEHLAQIFADHQPAAYVAKVREVRQLAPGAALLRGVAGMVPPGESTIKPEVNTIHVLVAVELDGGWRVAHFQATPAAFHGRPEAAEALTAELQAALEAENSHRYRRFPSPGR
jgi:uncharacterized protein (TIGR02246 family)